ncbi:MAG TPA: hypothetical protein PLF29_02240, partial [bacterium]|nr:hypothetical protein [bacterium]
MESGRIIGRAGNERRAPSAVVNERPTEDAVIALENEEESYKIRAAFLTLLIGAVDLKGRTKGPDTPSIKLSRIFHKVVALHRFGFTREAFELIISAAITNSLSCAQDNKEAIVTSALVNFDAEELGLPPWQAKFYLSVCFDLLEQDCRVLEEGNTAIFGSSERQALAFALNNNLTPDFINSALEEIFFPRLRQEGSSILPPADSLGKAYFSASLGLYRIFLHHYRAIKNSSGGSAPVELESGTIVPAGNPPPFTGDSMRAMFNRVSARLLGIVTWAEQGPLSLPRGTTPPLIGEER